MEHDLFLCGVEVPLGAKRRIVHPSQAKDASIVRVSFCNVLGVQLEECACNSDVVYACKPCFTKLRRAETQRRVSGD